MITRFFDNTRPITILFLFVLLVLTIVITYVGYYNSVEIRQTYLIQNHYKNISEISAVILSSISIIGLALLVNNIVHKNSITKRNSFTLLFFVLLVASNPSLIILNPVLAGAFFVVLALKSLLSLHEHKKMTAKLFNAGLFIGIASVVYPYAIFYTLLIYLGIIIYGADHWRQWFLPLIAIMIPYYLLFTLYFWNDNLDVYWDKFFINKIDLANGNFYTSKETMIVWGIYSLLTMFSIMNYTSNMREHKLDTKKGYSMTYLALFIGILITMFGTISNGQELVILFLPISIIWAKYIQHQKKEKFKTMFFMLIIFNAILSNIINSEISLF